MVLTFLLALFLSGKPASANDVLVIQGLRATPFGEALRGLKSVCKATLKAVDAADKDGPDIVKIVREERPALIVAMGADALRRVKKITDTPIIYLMALNPGEITGAAANMTGISMYIPPQRYLAIMEKLNLPKTRVGILYDPSHSGNYVKRALQAARPKSMEITVKEVHRAKDVPDLLNRSKGSFNLIWMIPDPTVVTPETVEFILSFSERNNIPVVTFAGKYVQMGALFSLDIDSFDMGKQAGEMAIKVLDGTPVSEIPKADARKLVVKINRNVAKNLGINLNALEEAANSAK